MKAVAASLIIIVIVISGAALILGSNYLTVNGPENNQQQTQYNQSSGSSTETPRQSTTSRCTNKGTVNFTSPPRRLEDVEIIQPIGMINANGHVTPTDHGYYYPPNWNPDNNPANFKDVLAPADGTITTVQLVAGRQGDYRLVIHHTCTFYTIYIHVYELSERLSQAIGEMNVMTKNTNIPVSAGEVIGRSNSFDFSVHNDDIVLKGFVYPEHYNGEPWKIHTVDMFEYFVEPIKSQLLSKNMRTAEPLGGRIDYDIDGRLIGNWFRENTNWYAGIRQSDGSYWDGHLALAYDALDPKQTVVSFGNFDGKPGQFGIKSNPDPADVSKESGMVKYELVTYDHYKRDGTPWDRHSFAQNLQAKNNDGDLKGVVLFQLVEDRKLKVETFPNKTALQVTGFTSDAKIYER